MRDGLVEGLVPAGTDEPKSGCLWCPLLPWSHDFDTYAARYQRSAEKITAREKDGHVVRTRCVGEPWDECDVMFVGEAPGKVEDDPKWGTPFVGKSGQMLRRTIEHVVPGVRIAMSNAVACFERTARVVMPDGSSEEIAKLVNSGYRGDVWAFDGARFRLRRVVGTHANPLGDRTFLRISHRYAKKNGRSKDRCGPIATNDHEFLTERGWVRADELDGENLLVGPGLTQTQLETAIGCLLGDGTISKNAAVLDVTHAESQREWLELKAGVFEARIRTRGRMSSAPNFEFEALREGFCGTQSQKKGRGRSVPTWLPDRFTWRIAAVFFVDDGYTRHRPGRRDVAEIAATSRSPEELETIRRAFNALGVSPHVRRGRLIFDVEETEKLVRGIAEFVPLSMRYKLGNSTRGLKSFDRRAWILGAARPFYAEAVVTVPPYKDHQTVFCLSVADDENFLTTGGVAHNCRPPRNRDPNKTEIQSCSPKLLREIAARKPKLVVVLGNTALELLTGQRGITTFCGRVLDCIRPEFPGLKVLACLHPAYVLRFDHELDRFVDAIGVAATVLSGDYVQKAGVGRYEVVQDAQTAVALLGRLAASKTAVASDTETGALSPFDPVLEELPHLLCFSFSVEEGVGYVIPWDHEESPFSTQARAGESIRDRHARRLNRMTVQRALAAFFDSAAPKVMQNASYDIKHIRKAVGVEPRNVVFDTMTGHYVIDERRGTHGLKQLAYAYTGMGGYEAPLGAYIAAHAEADPERGGSYARVPGSVLFPYAGMDADVTLRVYNGIQAEPDYQDNPKLRALSESLYPSLAYVLADMEYEGAAIDPLMVETLAHMYQRRMRELDIAIQEFEPVKAFLRDRSRSAESSGDRAKLARSAEPFNPRSTQQLQSVLFGYCGEAPVELSNGGLSKLAHRLQVLNEAWVALPLGKRGPKPGFGQVVERAVEAKEWEYFSTKADVMHELARRGNKLCPLILEYRGFSTLNGTFVEPLTNRLDAKRRIHGSFSPTGTVTGRLSSHSPNLQNWPNKGSGLLKRCYLSRFGDAGLILQADLSQIELRIAACWFNEPVMIRAYQKGEDLHRQTAIDISGLTPEKYDALPKDDKKGWRVRAKRTNFGPLYGGGVQAIVHALRKDGVFVTDEEGQRLLDRFWAKRKGLASGMEREERKTRKLGYVESFTGHRRRVPEVYSEDEKLVARALRQSINAPIQCGAAAITLMALILAHREMRAREMRSKLILTVHDSIAADCFVDEVFEVARILRNAMELITERSDEVIPGIDWKWLRVPIVADLESGFTWGSCVEWKECKANGVVRTIDPDDPDVDHLWDAMAEASYSQQLDEEAARIVAQSVEEDDEEAA